MRALVYRCRHCGREVLVRRTDPLSDATIARLIEEEFRPVAQGRPGMRMNSERLRDDIWLALSEGSDPIPRDELPPNCPACHEDTLEEARALD